MAVSFRGLVIMELPGLQACDHDTILYQLGKASTPTSLPADCAQSSTEKSVLECAAPFALSPYSSSYPSVLCHITRIPRGRSRRWAHRKISRFPTVLCETLIFEANARQKSEMLIYRFYLRAMYGSVSVEEVARHLYTPRRNVARISFTWLRSATCSVNPRSRMHIHVSSCYFCLPISRS